MDEQRCDPFQAIKPEIRKSNRTFEKLVNERGNVNGNEWSFVLESRELGECTDEKNNASSDMVQFKLFVLYALLF